MVKKIRQLWLLEIYKKYSSNILSLTDFNWKCKFYRLKTVFQQFHLLKMLIYQIYNTLGLSCSLCYWCSLHTSITFCGVMDRSWSMILTDQASWFGMHAIRWLVAKFNHRRVKVYNLCVFKSFQFKHSSNFKSFKCKKRWKRPACCFSCE